MTFDFSIAILIEWHDSSSVKSVTPLFVNQVTGGPGLSEYLRALASSRVIPPLCQFEIRLIPNVDYEFLSVGKPHREERIRFWDEVDIRDKE